MKKNSKTLILTQMALLSAIIVIMGFTPLGSLPLGGPIVATLAQIPVVIGACLMGTGAGMVLGGVFGAVSFAWFTIYAPPSAFLFSPVYSVSLADGNIPIAIFYAIGSILICFGARILIGLVSGKTYTFLFKKTGNVIRSSITAGVLGSLTNTVTVLTLILIFFAKPYESLGGGIIWMLFGTTILINGIPEAIVTPIITTAVVKPLSLLNKK